MNRQFAMNLVAAALVTAECATVVSTLTGCTTGGAGSSTAPTTVQTPSVQIPEVKVKVSNPLASKAMSVADSITVNASGELNKGNYQVGNHRIVVARDTNFTLVASVPLKGQSQPDLAAGTGTLTLSNSISFDGVAIPTKIEVKSHAASASLDFVGMVVTFVANSLPHPGETVDPISNIVRRLSVSKAEISLKPEQPVEIGGVQFVIKPGSKFVFNNVEYASPTNYHGRCTIQIAGAQDVRAKIGDNEISAKSLSTLLTTKVTAQSGRTTFILEDPKWAHITLSDCHLKNPRESVQVVSCKLLPDRFEMALSSGNWKTAAMSLAGNVDAQQAALNIDSSDKKLTGNLPKVNADFDISMSDSKKSVAVSIPGAVDANSVILALHHGDKDIDLKLTQAKLSQLQIKMPGTIAVQAANGEFGLSELHWKHGDKVVSLRPKSGNATSARVVLPAGINVQGNTAKPIKCQIKLGPGVIDIAAGGKRLTCDDMSGTADVSIDGTDLNMKGAFSAKVIPRQGAFGIPGFDAQLGSVGLQLSGQNTALTFDDTRLLLSESELSELVQNHLPKSKTVEVNKQLIEGTPWRYKNLVLKRIDITKPFVKDIKFAGENNATCTCGASAKLQGTVEKLHPIGAILRRNNGADIKDWNAAADVSGPAIAKFAVIPGATLADSKVKADIAFELKKLENAKLDWSGVAGSIVGKAESGVLSATLAALKSYIAGHSIPLHANVEKPLLKRADPRMKMISIRSVKLAPASKGVQIVLSGAVKF